MSEAESAGARTTSRRVRDEESIVAALNSTPGVTEWEINEPIEGVFRAVVRDDSALERLMDARPATVYPLRIRRESGEVVLKHRDAMARRSRRSHAIEVATGTHLGNPQHVTGRTRCCR